MILDSILLFGKNITHVSKSASSVISFTNVLQMDTVKGMLLNNASADAINLNSKINDPGRGGDILLNVRITSSASGLMASSSAAHLQIRLHGKASASSIKSGSVLMNWEVKSIKKSGSQMSFAKNGRYLLRAKIPPDVWGSTTLDNIGLTTKVITGKLVKGKLTAWLGRSDDDVL